MRRFSVLIFSLVFAVSFAVSAFGQGATAPTGRVGLVNVSAFASEKDGIPKFRNAILALEKEFEPSQKELNDLQTRLQTLVTQIENDRKTAAAGTVPVKPETIQTKIDEAQSVELQIKRKGEDLKAKYERRYQQVVGVAFSDIVKGLNEFAKQKGYSMILDGAKLEEAGILMGFDEKYDVTKEFVTFYNARPSGTATRN